MQVDIPGQENEGFEYDAVGNRLSEDGVEGEWTYNANNELLTVATTEYTYDADGNATQLLLDGTAMFTYHYNTQDRLVKVDDVNGGIIAEYAYDPFGRRLWKEVGGTRTYFFYVDEGLVAEYDVSGTELRSYGYRPDSTWTTDPLWLKQNGEYYFYQNDHLGTPQKLVQMNGAIAWSATYTMFGQANVDIEIVTNHLRFSGQYEDGETGLHYNWMRYYHPNIGRFLTADPSDRIINVYSYCVNNPVIFLDPYGLFHQGWRAANDLSKPWGHSDFPGSVERTGKGGCFGFDYNLEDTDWNTSPLNFPEGTKRHFRSLYRWGEDPGIQYDLTMDVAICSRFLFERHMHQGQDDYTHFSKGYRLDNLSVPYNRPFPELEGGELALFLRINLQTGVIQIVPVPGHAGNMNHDPDKDYDAWKKAKTWTEKWLAEWEKSCCCMK